VESAVEGSPFKMVLSALLFALITMPSIQMVLVGSRIGGIIFVYSLLLVFYISYGYLSGE